VLIGGDIAGSGEDPICLLRSVFLYLREDGVLPRLHSHVLDVLSARILDPLPPLPAIPMWHGKLEPGMRRAFRRSLRRNLFGWDDLLSLRIRLSVADYCWVCELPRCNGAQTDLNICACRNSQ
jgi:general transcription factor 3C polypeptide 4